MTGLRHRLGARRRHPLVERARIHHFPPKIKGFTVPDQEVVNVPANSTLLFELAFRRSLSELDQYKVPVRDARYERLRVVAPRRHIDRHPATTGSRPISDSDTSCPATRCVSKRTSARPGVLSLMGLGAVLFPEVGAPLAGGVLLGKLLDTGIKDLWLPDATAMRGAENTAYFLAAWRPTAEGQLEQDRRRLEPQPDVA